MNVLLSKLGLQTHSSQLTVHKEKAGQNKKWGVWDRKHIYRNGHKQGGKKNYHLKKHWGINTENFILAGSSALNEEVHLMHLRKMWPDSTLNSTSATDFAALITFNNLIPNNILTKQLLLDLKDPISSRKYMKSTSYYWLCPESMKQVPWQSEKGRRKVTCKTFPVLDIQRLEREYGLKEQFLFWLFFYMVEYKLPETYANTYVQSLLVF